MSVHTYVTRFGIIRHDDVCHDDFRNIETVGLYPAHPKKGAYRRERGYLLKLQGPAMASLIKVEGILNKEVVLTGSWRSCALQKQLYDSDHSRYAHPNSTLHTQGLAIDVNTNVLNDRIHDALCAHGWKQSRPDDEPWHFSFYLKA